MNQPLTQQRIRITFSKRGSFRLIGHLDLAKTWERVLRRADVPVEYSQGFNPHPRMQFAAALPVGVSSESEYLDVWLTERLSDPFPEAWIDHLNEASPAGLRVTAIQEVPIKGAALPTLVTSAEYVITVLDGAISPDELRRRTDALLAAPEIQRMRNKKQYDLRPLIEDLAIDEEGHLIARLVTGDRGNGRPDELLDALGIEPMQAHLHRCNLVLSDES